MKLNAVCCDTAPLPNLAVTNGEALNFKGQWTGLNYCALPS